MSGICDICKRSECVERQDGAWNCDKYLSYASKDTRHESNYEKLFGTPERAARTLAGIACDDGGCEGCPLYDANCSYDSDTMLEWLRGDA